MKSNPIAAITALLTLVVPVLTTPRDTLTTKALGAPIFIFAIEHAGPLLTAAFAVMLVVASYQVGRWTERHSCVTIGARDLLRRLAEGLSKNDEDGPSP